MDATVAYANAHYVPTRRLSYISRLPNGHSPASSASCPGSSVCSSVCVITAFTKMHTLTSYFCQFSFGNRLQKATGYRLQPPNSKHQPPTTGRPRDLKSHLCLLPKWCNKKSECCPQVAPGDPMRCDAMLYAIDRLLHLGLLWRVFKWSSLWP